MLLLFVIQLIRIGIDVANSERAKGSIERASERARETEKKRNKPKRGSEI